MFCILIQLPKSREKPLGGSPVKMCFRTPPFRTFHTSSFLTTHHLFYLIHHYFIRSFSMTSQKQIIANRKNARKSTGPVTVQGKEIIAHNAIKHGLLSGHLLLPDESEIQLEQLRNSIFSSLAPRGALEFFLAERVLAAA
jgi:hypothetical protein